MSWKSKQRYINPGDDRVKIGVLSKDADEKPMRHKTWVKFKASFGNVNYFTHTIAGYTVVVGLSYAFKHFTDNTYHQHRKNENATLLPTLTDPLIVVKDTYKGQSVLNFYKPFKTEDELFHMMMFQALEEDGQYKFRTIYSANTMSKVKEVLKATDGNTVYFKYE